MASLEQGSGEGNAITSSVNSLTELMRQYFGFNDSKLQQHALNQEHEDVPTPPIKEEVSKGTHKPRRSFEDRAPARLTSQLPPGNFGAVIPGKIYRSSFPKEENFGFLDQLKLRSILTLVPEPYPEANVKYMQEHNIRHFQVHIPANKEEVRIEPARMAEALSIVLDPANYPMLLHCNKGKHRTGCVVGCLRKVQGEKLDSIFNEYHTYAGVKARILDEMFMKSFDERMMLWLAVSNCVIPADEPTLTSPAVSPGLNRARSRV